MAQRKKAGVSPKTIKWIWGVVFAPFALLAVMLLLTALGLFGRMPSFEELENPRSNQMCIRDRGKNVCGFLFFPNFATIFTQTPECYDEIDTQG